MGFSVEKYNISRVRCLVVRCFFDCLLTLKPVSEGYFMTWQDHSDSLLRAGCINLFFFYSFNSFRDLFTCSLFYSTYTTGYYYELTNKIRGKVTWGRRGEGKACESGQYQCDSTRKVSTVGHLGVSHGKKSREEGHALPPRCPTVETFRVLSHGYRPLSHAFPPVFLPSPSHLFALKLLYPSRLILLVSS